VPIVVGLPVDLRSKHGPVTSYNGGIPGLVTKDKRKMNEG